jgi:hypothetical protein
MALRLHLPQCDADADPAVAVAGHRRGRLAGKHRIDHPPLGRKGCGIAARRHYPLKGMVVHGVERPGLAQPVPRWVRRIEMRAGNPPLRHRFGGGMGSPTLQEPRQHVRVRSLRALAGRRRDRLIDLDAAEPADEDAVRIGCEDR